MQLETVRSEIERMRAKLGSLSPQQEVKFGDTKEGMFAIRLAAPLEEEQPKNIAEPKRTGTMAWASGS